MREKSYFLLVLLIRGGAVRGASCFDGGAERFFLGADDIFAALDPLRSLLASVARAGGRPLAGLFGGAQELLAGLASGLRSVEYADVGAEAEACQEAREPIAFSIRHTSSCGSARKKRW